MHNSKNLLSHVAIKDYADRIQTEFNFTYDALNRRISKSEKSLDLDVTHNYLYDGANIIAILDKNKDILATITHDESIDTPLSITTYSDMKTDEEIIDNFTHVEKAIYEDSRDLDKEYLIESKKTPQTYYYHRDHQGSIIALTDKEANIVESFIYDESYGKILDHETTVQTYNPYAYTGREFDADDLYYYRARYYDPQTQRFLSEDPIEFLSGDFNWYRYVGNNPVNFNDPSGLLWFLAIPVIEWMATYGAATAVVAGTAVRVAPVAQRAITMGPKAAKAIKQVARTVTVPQAPPATDQAKEEDEATEEVESKNVTTTKIDTGLKANGKAKAKEEEDPCGEYMSYKDAKKDLPSAVDGIKYERDHMPSGGALKKYALKVAEELDLVLNECMMNEILNDAKTAMMPKTDHADGSDTYKSKNTQEKMKNDASDLNKAKNKDAKKMKEHLQEERKKNEKETDPKKKQRREDCIDSIEKALDSEEFAEFDPKGLVDDTLMDYKEGVRTSKLKNGKTRKCWDNKITK